ncbi:hypothetical protein PAXINDRAFT_166552 [Paxillus involutus ATCC 200175]|nr:hypothetical protein PAXINDRAFT_166552 [Paxillus involutus ATCC 200175]
MARCYTLITTTEQSQTYSDQCQCSMPIKRMHAECPQMNVFHDYRGGVVTVRKRSPMVSTRAANASDEGDHTTVTRWSNPCPTHYSRCRNSSSWDREWEVCSTRTYCIGSETS